MKLWDPEVLELEAMLENEAKSGNPEPFQGPPVPSVDPLFSDREGEQLLKALLLAKGPYEMSLLVRDLLTDHQIGICKKKLHTAYMLASGIPYESIEGSAHIVPRQIAQISKKLKDPQGGYAMILGKLYPFKFSRNM